MQDQTTQTPASAKQTSKESKFKTWLNQPNNRNILAVLSLGFFFIIIIVGVLIAQKQLSDRNATAPNAPASQPEAAAGICSLQFTVPAPSTAPINFSCTKSSYANDNRNNDPASGGRYYLVTEKEVFRPGEIVVFDVVFLNPGTTRIDIEMNDNLGGSTMGQYATFLDSDCGVGAYNPQTKILTCTVEDVAPNSLAAQAHRSFRVRLSNSIPANTTIRNLVTMREVAINEDPGDQLAGGTAGRAADPTAAPRPAQSCEVTIRVEANPTPPPTPTFACNSVCKTDTQCQSVDANYICYYSQNNDTTTISTAPTGRCRLKANPTEAVCKATVTLPSPTPPASPRVSPSPSASPRVSPTPTPSTTYACNATCATDEQCRGVNAGYICHPDLKVCRLDTNRSSASCQPQQNSYACNSACTTNAQCQTANGSYICSNGQCRLDSNPTATSCLPASYVPPTPAIGCNDTCSSNSDCSNPDHICSTTADGTNRCRLADYTNSATCSKPPQTTASVPGQQPQLPEQLPQTGAFEFGNWLKAGVAALGIGAVLLLFL